MLLLKKILILFLTAGLMVGAWYMHEFLKNILQPKRSFTHFIIFFVANVAMIFGLIFLLSLLLYQYRNFFFKP